jgi:methylmalonyl-CoA mutase N-terminal domain/subunit
VEKEILNLLNKIEQMGGLIKAVETGWIHTAISDVAYAYQQSVESGETPIVGVNCYRSEDEELPCEIFEIPETLAIQGEKLARIKKERSDVEVQRSLDDIARCCYVGKNLMEVMVDSVQAPVTLGETARVIKGSFGTWNLPLF